MKHCAASVQQLRFLILSNVIGLYDMNKYDMQNLIYFASINIMTYAQHLQAESVAVY